MLKTYKKFFFLFALNFLPLILVGAEQNFDTVGVLVAIDRHVLSLRKGKIDKAYSLTSYEFQNETSIDQFVEFIQSHDVLNENQSIALGKLAIVEKTAQYEGLLTSQQDKEMEVHYVLVKQGPDWKIRSILLLEIPKEKEVVAPLVETSLCTRCQNPNCKRKKESLFKQLIGRFF